MSFHQIRQIDALPLGPAGEVQQRTQTVAPSQDRVDTLVFDFCQVKPGFGIMEADTPFRGT